VLEGGKEVIEAYRPAMLIEIEARHTARYGHSPEDVAGWLLKRGYAMHTWRRGWREVDRVEPGIRNYLFRPLASTAMAPRRNSRQAGSHGAAC
jgi:hypothetical protein